MAARRRFGLVAAISALALGAIAPAGAQPSRSSGDQTAVRFFPAEAGVESSGDELAGEVLVDLKDDVSSADVADIASKYGLRLHDNSSWSADHDKFEVADVDPADEDSVIERLAHDPRVENVERMSLLKASFVPNDPLYESKQWHLKRVGAERAWDYTCGMGVTVAVIDTGVACFDKGPFMKGTDLSGTRCEGGYNFVDNSKEAYDDHGHGTHVAGTIAQTTHNGKGVAGLAYCATLMPIKVLSKRGFGTVANVAEGIRFAADNGAQVINMSLGGPIKSKVLEQAVKHAISKGVVIVAAAGNSGKEVGYPAAYPGVVAVSATDANDKLAWFSSRGPELAIAAPGVNVTQQTVCDGGKNKCEIFGTFSGTSMASPHVAGVAAMIVGMGVTEANAVKQVLQSTAIEKGEPNLYGAGILNGAAAVTRTHFWHVALRLGALFALFALVARRIRRRGGEVAKSKLAWLAAIVTSVGLLPILPLLKLAPHVGGFRTAFELAMRPIGEWDLLWGAGLHKWLVLASAIPVLALTMLLFQSRLRRFVGGFALGTAALATQIALSGDVAFWAGPMMLRVWTIGSALVCLWIARIALDAKRA